MAEAATITQDDIPKLRQFHQQHFPGQPVPSVQPTSRPEDHAASTGNYDDLGCYEDGVRRTLTDEQIAMFRHSEIQRLLAERRRKQEAEEEHQKRLTKKRKAIVEDSNGQQTRLYATDAVVHAQNEVQKLSYDDGEDVLKTEPEKQKPKTFQWPVLGL